MKILNFLKPKQKNNLSNLQKMEKTQMAKIAGGVENERPTVAHETTHIKQQLR